MTQTDQSLTLVCLCGWMVTTRVVVLSHGETAYYGTTEGLVPFLASCNYHMPGRWEPTGSSCLLFMI